MAPIVEVLHDEKLTLGEEPYWDHETQVLYYVDMMKSTVFKYVPNTKILTRVIIDKQNNTRIGFVVRLAGEKDKFVIGYGNAFAILTWDGVSTEPTSLEILIDVQPGLDTILNDGKVDPQGRLWSGTMSKNPVIDGSAPRVGEFYSLNADGKSVTKHFDGVGISNGLTWSIDQKTFYYIDSLNFAVHAFDYDIDKCEIKNRRTVFDSVKNGIKGLLDGMTIDTGDKLWIAVFGDGIVIQVDPKTGSVLQTIELPAYETTSVAWGGPNLDELYVTSANFWLLAGEKPFEGRVFKITGLGASGIPAGLAKL